MAWEILKNYPVTTAPISSVSLILEISVWEAREGSLDEWYQNIAEILSYPCGGQGFTLTHVLLHFFRYYNSNLLFVLLEMKDGSTVYRYCWQ